MSQLRRDGGYYTFLPPLSHTNSDVSTVSLLSSKHTLHVYEFTLGGQVVDVFLSFIPEKLQLPNILTTIHKYNNILNIVCKKTSIFPIIRVYFVFALAWAENIPITILLFMRVHNIL